MAETSDIVGVVEHSEPSRSGKSTRLKIRTDNDKEFWISCSADKTPPPVGGRFKIRLSKSEWPKGSGKYTSWVEQYKVLGDAPQRANGSAKGDTFPTVEEQFIKEVAGNPHVNPCDPGALRMAVANALSVWDEYKAGKLRASAPAASPTSDMMDAPSVGGDEFHDDPVPF